MNHAVQGLIEQAREAEHLRRQNAMLHAENMRLKAENHRLKTVQYSGMVVGTIKMIESTWSYGDGT